VDDSFGISTIFCFHSGSSTVPSLMKVLYPRPSRCARASLRGDLAAVGNPNELQYNAAVGGIARLICESTFALAVL
jgi:hypothetical protein